MRKWLWSATLIGLLSTSQVAQSNNLYDAYFKNVNKSIEKTNHIPNKFVLSLYSAFLGTKDKGEVVSGSYREKAWLFENTMALIGSLSEFNKKDTYDMYSVYRQGVKKLIGLIDDGRVQDYFDTEADGTVKEERLRAYYTAIAVGVLAGIGPGFIPYPDKAQAERYGEVAMPIYYYRASMQQLRTAVLSGMTYRIAYRKAQLATLYYFAFKYCKGPVMEETQKRIDPSTVPGSVPNVAETILKYDNPANWDYITIGKLTATYRYRPVLLAIADLKESLIATGNLLAGQGNSNAYFSCLMILTHLHNSAVNMEIAELLLYQLSAQYGVLSSMEKAGLK